MHSLFSTEEIAARLSGSLIGRKIHFLEEVDSTNTFAMQLARNGAEEGEAVIAESQSGGRGRLRGRKWQSPPHVNLYPSIIPRPAIAAADAASMTLMAGVAVADVLSEYCPGTVHLKWPNDVLVGMKKICGILTEMKAKEAAVEYVVIGIGLNINIKRDDFLEEFRGQSTSLLEETRRETSRNEAAAELFDSLGEWQQLFLNHGFDRVRSKWLDYAGILGRRVEVKSRNIAEKGTVLGIDEEGALLLEGDTSQILRILSGDIYLNERD